MGNSWGLETLTTWKPIAYYSSSYYFSITYVPTYKENYKKGKHRVGNSWGLETLTPGKPISYSEKPLPLGYLSLKKHIKITNIEKNGRKFSLYWNGIPTLKNLIFTFDSSIL